VLRPRSPTKKIRERERKTNKHKMREEIKTSENTGRIRTESIPSHIMQEKNERENINLTGTYVRFEILCAHSMYKKIDAITKHLYIEYRILVVPVIFPSMLQRLMEINVLNLNSIFSTFSYKLNRQDLYQSPVFRTN